MKKKTKLITIVIVVLFIILLFPIRLQYKDGGSTAYRSIVGIYEVTNWNRIGISAENFENLKTGITVKLFGIKVFDNTKTELKGEFEVELQNSQELDTFAAISTEHFPVEMPADDMFQKAKDSGFVVFEGIDVVSGEEIWQEFYEKTQNGETAIVYLANYYTLDKDRMSEELYEKEKAEYPKIFLSSLYFDGEQYQITTRPGYEEEAESVRTYPYLVRYEGEPSSVSATFSHYVYYVLVEDKEVTWAEIEHGVYSSQMGDYIAHHKVYSDVIFK